MTIKKQLTQHMKTNIKISIIALAALFMQSCNMAKHYGNMRINHPKEEKIEDETENKTVINITQTPQEQKLVSTCDGTELTEVSTATTDTIQEVNTPALENTSLKKNESKKTTDKKKINAAKKLTRKLKPRLAKKINLRKPGSAQNEMTIDQWGYIAAGLTVAAFIALIIITGSFLAALVLAIQFFLALLSLIAIGAICYVFWVILEFLSGGFY
jgi:hypothetical protein